MDVKRFFEERFRQYGRSPKALDWSEEGQTRRFEVLAEVGDLSGRRILDLGSGLGDLFGFLSSRFPGVNYTGYEWSDVLVGEARKNYPNATFEIRDVLEEDFSGDFDFVLSSGLHNLETGTNDEDVERLLQKAWKVAGEGVALNMLSIYADRVREGCHKYDPQRVLSAALKLTRHVVLRHDYMPHDFTLYLYKERRKA